MPKSKDIIDGLFDEAVKSVKGVDGVPLMKMREMQSKFGVTRYCSTGYPSWDLHMFSNEDNSEWGWPYGRIAEIYGQQGALKTYVVLDILAENISKGGHSYLITSEMDFDTEHASSFLRKRGIKDNVENLEYGVKPAFSMSDMYDATEALIKPYRDAADKIEKKGGAVREELPPIVLAVDSMGAMISHGDKEALNKDGLDSDPRIGQKAQEIHRFFQDFMMDFARLGVLFVYTNHYRDNIGFGRKKYKPAHNSALKYYPSLRLEFKRGYDQKLAQERSSQHVAYKDGFPFVVKVKKIRNNMALAGEFEITFINNIGLDWIHSLMDAAMMSDVVRFRSGTFRVEFEDDDELSEYNGKYARSDFRKLIKEDVEFRVKLEERCLKAGPKKPQEL